jgi:hypothetical protein
MKIKVKSTGNVFLAEKHWLLAILADAGVIEYVPEHQDVPPACNPRWFVGERFSGEPCVSFRCCKDSNQDFFGVTKIFSHHGTTLPKEIFDKYREAVMRYMTTR